MTAMAILLVLALVVVVAGLMFLFRKRIWWVLAALVLAVAVAAAVLFVQKAIHCSDATLTAMDKLCRAGDRADCERERTRLLRCGLDIPSDLPRP